MTSHQRVIGLAGGALLVVLVVCPPWICYFNGGPQLERRYYEPVSRSIGHHVIFLPPNSNDPLYFQTLFDGAEVYSDPRFYEFRIDFTRLSLLALLIGVITGVGIWLAGPKRVP